jgi:hypothetical protein
MVADYVSPNFGRLHSPDGTEDARVIIRAGKNCDGYLDASDIQEQADKAMDLVSKHWPAYEDVFIYTRSELREHSQHTKY